MWFSGLKRFVICISFEIRTDPCFAQFISLSVLTRSAAHTVVRHNSVFSCKKISIEVYSNHRWIQQCCRTSVLYSIGISVAFDEPQPVYINSIYSRILNACLDRMGDFYSAIAVVVAIATENKTDFPRRKRAK